MNARVSQMEIIQPANPLKQKVGPPRASDPGLLDRAEARVADLADDYRSWVQGDLENLEARMDHAAAMASAGERREAWNAAYVIAHDIKGQGTTFDYPLVTHVANSLCRYIEKTVDLDRTDPKIAQAHLGALRAILVHDVRGDGGALGQQVVDGLTQVVQKGLKPLDLSV